MGKIKIFTEYETESVCSLWTDIFGKYEAELERPQIDGSESEYNVDTVFCAEENGKLVGTVHITIPKKNHNMAGISGVCCLPAARGKGIARLLMSKAMETLGEYGVQTAFLGTGNPVAAKLYSSFGFSYLPGSRVMANNLLDRGSIFDVYNGEKDDIKIVRGTPDFRIPLIGLVNLNEKLIIADINAGIMGRAFFSQNSCMGLYPKYENVCTCGGDFFGAVDSNGTLGAIATVLPTDIGMRMDVCIDESFSSCLKELIDTAEKRFGQVYFQITTEEITKVNLVKKAGFKLKKTIMHPVGDYCLISTEIWTR